MCVCVCVCVCSCVCLRLYKLSYSHAFTGVFLHHIITIFSCYSLSLFSWYRGKISDYNPGTHEYRVFFVDYGEEEWVEETAVQHISPDLLQLPAQAVLCSLEGTANLRECTLYLVEIAIRAVCVCVCVCVCACLHVCERLCV